MACSTLTLRRLYVRMYVFVISAAWPVKGLCMCVCFFSLSPLSVSLFLSLSLSLCVSVCVVCVCVCVCCRPERKIKACS